MPDRLKFLANGTEQEVDVSPANPLPVTGAVTSSGTVGISGTVAVAGTVGISGTVATTGTVAVSSVGGTVATTGTVAVSSVGGTVATTGTVAVSSVGGTVATQETKSATGTQSSVAGSASSVTVLASNASRLGATVANDSTSVLYLLLKTGGTATTSAYTVQLPPAGSVPALYEVPFNYTGDIIGIWASANGNARVTEFT